MLQENQPAPAINTINQDGKTINLDDYRNSKNIVLYFYPKDDTPGCTTEGKQFTELASEFAAADTVILGVSKDDCDSHIDFIKKYSFNFDLLSDTSGELCERYGVWQEKEKNGVKKMGIVRSTFVINKEGVLVAAMYGVSADGHASEILARVKKLSS